MALTSFLDLHNIFHLGQEKSGYERRKFVFFFFFYYSTALHEILERWLMLCNNHLDTTPLSLLLSISSTVCRLISDLLSTNNGHVLDGSLSSSKLNTIPFNVIWCRHMLGCLSVETLKKRLAHTLTHLLFLVSLQVDQEGGWQVWGALWSFLGRSQNNFSIIVFH